MTFLFGGQFGAAVLAIALCTPAIADDVLFENVRIFDGKSAVLSAPSNVLVKGNVIETISEAPIGAEGVTRIAGAGRTLMPGLIDMHWHAMLVRPNPLQAISGDLGYTNLLAGAEATATLMRGFTTIRDMGGAEFRAKARHRRRHRGRAAYLPVRRDDHDHRRPRRLSPGFPTCRGPSAACRPGWSRSAAA